MPGDPSSSGASKEVARNEDLLTPVKERQNQITKSERVDVAKVLAEAVTASASGLAPQTSSAYTDLLVPRVVRGTG